MMLKPKPTEPSMGINESLQVIPREDGCTLLHMREVLPDYPARVSERLCHWAAVTPHATFLAERDGAGWRRLTYRQALVDVRAVAQGLLERDLSVHRPVVILSGNSIHHAVLGLACLHVGIPYIPVSTAYSFVGADLGKLRLLLRLTTPGLVFAEGAARVDLLGAAIPLSVETANDLASIAQQPGPEVDVAAELVGEETIAKLLFTSGSSGAPKAVINTHGMLCSNQAMIASRFRFVLLEPPVLVDWLPWSHTFGGNHNFNLVLFNGGSLFIDPGRPLPGQFRATVAALREVAPTLHLTVPKAWAELAPHLRADPALNRHFHSRLRVSFCAGASLPQALWDELGRLSAEATGQTVPMVTGLGSTETAPMAMVTDGADGQAGRVGLPVPGVQVKLTPVDGKLEMRIKGPSVTPGFWRDPERTAAAFDAEGYYRTGDALIWVDPAQPGKGLCFDGRFSEDFKLSSGTWVSVGPLRDKLIAAMTPDVRDIVVAGHDRDVLAVLAIPHDPAIATDRAVRNRIGAILRTLAQTAGSATRVERFAFLVGPLSLDVGEVTDKGAVNQAAVLRNRAVDVAALYAEPPAPHVIWLPPKLTSASNPSIR